MEDDKSKFFSLMVVGENPDEMLKKYDSSLTVEPYVKFRFNDAGALREKAIKTIESVLEEKSKLNDFVTGYLTERLQALKSLSDFEYYSTFTSGLSYNEDGDAMSTENPDGKFKTCNIGRNLCIPLSLKDGTTAFSAHAKDVDWDAMNTCDRSLYELTWKLFNKEIEPSNETEQNIYDNVKFQKRYFEGFGSMDEYVNYSCSYWNYAYLDKNGWVDANDYKNYEWITSFFGRFVKTLNEDDLVSIYECSN